jgi:hypothetical protein
MSNQDFEKQHEFVSAITRLAQTLSDLANQEDKKLEVEFTIQHVGDAGMPEHICSLRYYPPNNVDLAAENAALKAAIERLQKRSE